MEKSDTSSASRWAQLLNFNRLGNRPSNQELGRSPFNSDHDKIVFSGAFRRLARKTQVHPLAKNDHVHNRLTHSLEVARVGRSLGIRVGYSLQDRDLLPKEIVPADIGDIVQATCLAHDIGNPPFGHTGEAAIRHWFSRDGDKYLNDLTESQRQDFREFEGNAQGFRVLTNSEYYKNDGGMRLTYATLASFIKYPWTSTSASARPKDDKFGVFQSELPYFREIAAAVGLPARAEADWYHRHPLVYLMEAADDFCYGLLDLEDGLEMGILKWEQIYEVLKPLIDPRDRDKVQNDLNSVSSGRKPSLIRGKIISRCVESATSTFIRYESELMTGNHSDLISLCDGDIKTYVKEAKELASREIFSDRKKIELEIGAYSAIATLLDVICGAVTEYIEAKGGTLSFKAKRVVDLLGEETLTASSTPWHSQDISEAKYFALMRVMDFISGMTDHYAVYLTKQFRGTGS